MSEHEMAAFRLECLKLALGFGPRADAIDLAGYYAAFVLYSFGDDDYELDSALDD